MCYRGTSNGGCPEGAAFPASIGWALEPIDEVSAWDDRSSASSLPSSTE